MLKKVYFEIFQLCREAKNSNFRVVNYCGDSTFKEKFKALTLLHKNIIAKTLTKELKSLIDIE
jgi:hypothetical protein